MTSLGTSKIPRVTKWLKSYTDPSLASKKSFSSPLLESNSSYVFFPTARVQQLTCLLPLCPLLESNSSHVFLPTASSPLSPTAHTSSSPLPEYNSSHVFFPTARVQQLTHLLPHCSSTTAHTSSSPLLESNSSHIFFPTARVQQSNSSVLKESQSSEWCCN